MDSCTGTPTLEGDLGNRQVGTGQPPSKRESPTDKLRILRGMTEVSHEGDVIYQIASTLGFSY